MLKEFSPIILAFLITSTASQKTKQDIHSEKIDQNVNYSHLPKPSLAICNYVECFWQFGIQNFFVAVLIDISAGLQGH